MTSDDRLLVVRVPYSHRLNTIEGASTFPSRLQLYLSLPPSLPSLHFNLPPPPLPPPPHTTLFSWLHIKRGDNDTSDIMPYTPPGSADVAVLIPTTPPTHSSPTRNHRRSFTDEHGLGAFAPILGLPKRRPTTGNPPPPPTLAHSSSSTGAKFAFPTVARPTSPASTKSPKFQLRGSEEDEDSDDSEDDERRDTRAGGLQVSVGAAVGRTVGVVEPTPHNDDNENQQDKVPFPTTSAMSTRKSPPPIVTVQRSASSPHISSPSTEDPPPSIYRSPHVSGPRQEPSTRRSVPLKPALKVRLWFLPIMRNR